MNAAERGRVLLPDRAWPGFKAAIRTAFDVLCPGPPTPPTARYFDLGCATIALEGRTLFWAVRAGPGAIARAHRHPLAVAMLHALATTRWSRESGGVFVADGYVARSYGPLGERADPGKARMALPHRLPAGGSTPRRPRGRRSATARPPRPARP